MTDVIKKKRPFDPLKNTQSAIEAATILRNALKDIFGEDLDFEILAKNAIEGETNLYESVSNLVKLIGETEVNIDALRQYETDLKSRRDRLSKRVELMKAAIETAAGIADVDTFKTPFGVVSIKALPASIVIVDETKIPVSYWKRSDPTLDRRSLLSDLKAKVEILGVSLSNGGTTIQIRR